MATQDSDELQQTLAEIARIKRQLGIGTQAGPLPASGDVPASRLPPTEQSGELLQRLKELESKRDRLLNPP